MRTHSCEGYVTCQHVFIKVPEANSSSTFQGCSVYRYSKNEFQKAPRSNNRNLLLVHVKSKASVCLTGMRFQEPCQGPDSPTRCLHLLQHVAFSDLCVLTSYSVVTNYHVFSGLKKQKCIILQIIDQISDTSHSGL